MFSKIPDKKTQFEILSKEQVILPEKSKKKPEEDMVKGMIDKINKILIDSKVNPEAFRQYSKRISQLSEISGSLSTEELKEKISVFAIQYLLKGAKIPLLPDDQNKYNLPILDYSEVIHPTYYRSDESSLNKIYEDLIQKKGYAFLFDKKNKFIVAFVKSLEFKRLLKGQFDWEKFKPKSSSFDEQLNELDERLKQGLTETKVLDLSSMLTIKKREALPPQELESRTKQINKILSDNKISDKVKVCAAAKLIDGQYVMIVFNENKILGPPINRVKQKGYRPDLPSLEKSLVALHFDEHLLNRAVGETTLKVERKEKATEERSLDEVLKKLKQLKEMTEEKFDEYPVYNYYGFLQSLLLEVKKLQTTHSTTVDDASKKIIQQSIEIIYKKLDQHEERFLEEGDIPFNDFLTDIDLIAEEIILQLCFVDAPPLKETIDQLMKKHVKVEGLKVEPRSYVYTSGMNSLAQLIFAIHRSKRPKEVSKQEGGTAKPVDTPVELGIVENIYFETRESFLEKLPRIIHKTEFDLNKEIKTPLPEVIFADLYTNNAPKYQAEKVSFKLMFPIEKLRSSAPVTLIIDTSTTMFYDQTVKKIVEEYKDLINEGSLNLVFANSLAKFSMCGLDKYQGGAIVVYNKGNMRTGEADKETVGAEAGFVEFNKKLAEYEAKEEITPEANAFFHLFLEAGDEVLKYKELINENTSYIYDELLSEDKTEGPTSALQVFSGDTIKGQYTIPRPSATLPKGLFLIDRKSKKIPFISIHIGTFADDLAQLKRAEAIKKQETQRLAKANKAARGGKIKLTDAQQKKIAEEELSRQKSELKKIGEEASKFRTALSPILREFIAMKGRTADLSIYSRRSFGFMHSGIADAATAVRLTVGLEEKETLDQYAFILKELNQELIEIANDPKLMKKFEVILSDKFKNSFTEEITNLKKTTSLKELIQSFNTK